ncbi:MAG: DUF4349 domain-containing protein [Pseudomarimonas sp.]
MVPMRVLMVVLCLLFVGCAKKSGLESSSSLSGEQGKPGSSLAYEHSIEITLPREVLAARMDAVRAACLDERFGACSLLSVEQNAGEHPRGALTVRLLPAAVEPLTVLAGEGGTVGSRETRAEDLAEAVADTSAQLHRLTLHREKLLQFQDREDLSVSDMLTIARELASVEAELQGQQRNEANQTRRLESNLLTLKFNSPFETSRFTRLSEAFTESIDTALDGVVDVIGYLAYCIPLLVVAFPLALFWRFLWRRATRRARSQSVD